MFSKDKNKKIKIESMLSLNMVKLIVLHVIIINNKLPMQVIQA